MQPLFRITLYRRAVLLVAAALLLAYAGLLQHQIVFHGGDDSDCVQCLAANHFGHALPSAASALSLSATTERPPVVLVAGFSSFSTRYFSARAPPLFL